LITCEGPNVLLTHRPCCSIQDAIKHGLGDTDEKARACARKSFRLLMGKWSTRARKLASDLPPTIQKMLHDSTLKPGAANLFNSLTMRLLMCRTHKQQGS
jgi:hypothetical protein